LWGAGVVICLVRGADLHIVQLIPLPLTVSFSSKSRLVLPFWYWRPGSPWQRAIKWLLLLFENFIYCLCTDLSLYKYNDIDVDED